MNTPKQSMKFQGTVQSGFGTGGYYVQLPHYFDAFTDLLKNPPFPGTLNVLFTEVDYSRLNSILQTIEPLVISGKSGVNDGTWKIESYCTKIWTDNEDDKVRALLLRFSRPDHKKEIIEFVSAHHLREKFNLQDNSFISFELVR